MVSSKSKPLESSDASFELFSFCFLFPKWTRVSVSCGACTMSSISEVDVDGEFELDWGIEMLLFLSSSYLSTFHF